MVIIDSTKQICQTCSSVKCIHFQAYEMCFYNYRNMFHTVQTSSIAGTKYFVLNMSTIVLQNKENFHIFQLLEGKWFCNTCSKLCNLKKNFENILRLIQPESNNKPPPKITYESISSNSLPFSFNLIQSQIYDKQILNGLDLPPDLLPELTKCQNGYEYSASNLKLEKTGIILYLENDVRELTEHKGTFLSLVIVVNHPLNLCSTMFV